MHANLRVANASFGESSGVEICIANVWDSLLLFSS